MTSGTVKTDARGEAFVVVKATPFKGHEALDLKFTVATTVTDSSRRVIKGSGEVKVTHSPFFIYPKPALAVYGPGDSVEINIKTENPNKQPVAGKFNVQAWRIRRVRKADGKFEEKLDQKLYDKPIEIGATGRAAVRFVPDVTGNIKIIVRQVLKDDKTKPVEGVCTLWIASKTGAARRSRKLPTASKSPACSATQALFCRSPRAGEVSTSTSSNGITASEPNRLKCCV